MNEWLNMDDLSSRLQVSDHRERHISHEWMTKNGYLSSRLRLSTFSNSLAICMTPSWRQKKKVPSSLASLLNRRSRSANLSSGTYMKTVLSSQKACSQQKQRRRRWKKMAEEEENLFGEMGWAKQQHESTSIITETERRSAHLHGGWVTDLQHCLVWADITFCATLSAVHSSIYIRCWATPKLSNMRQTHKHYRLPCCVKHHNCISTESPNRSWARALSFTSILNVSVLNNRIIIGAHTLLTCEATQHHESMGV